MRMRLAIRFFAAALLVAGSGCSSFDSRWKTAAAPNSPASRWDGRWTSEKHRAPGGDGPAGGRLRAVLTGLDPNGLPTQRITPSTKLRADFHANWLIFASSYTVTLEPVSGSRTDFRGTHELPKLFGGTYRYDSRLAGDRLSARYTSSYDHGTFALQRIPARRDSPPAHARH